MAFSATKIFYEVPLASIWGTTAPTYTTLQKITDMTLGDISCSSAIDYINTTATETYWKLNSAVTTPGFTNPTFSMSTASFTRINAVPSEKGYIYIEILDENKDPIFTETQYVPSTQTILTSDQTPILPTALIDSYYEKSSYSTSAAAIESYQYYGGRSQALSQTFGQYKEKDKTRIKLSWTIANNSLSYYHEGHDTYYISAYYLGNKEQFASSSTTSNFISLYGDKIKYANAAASTGNAASVTSTDQFEVQSYFIPSTYSRWNAQIVSSTAANPSQSDLTNKSSSTKWTHEKVATKGYPFFRVLQKIIEKFRVPDGWQEVEEEVLNEAGTDFEIITVNQLVKGNGFPETVVSPSSQKPIEIEDVQKYWDYIKLFNNDEYLSTITPQLVSPAEIWRNSQALNSKFSMNPHFAVSEDNKKLDNLIGQVLQTVNHSNTANYMLNDVTDIIYPMMNTEHRLLQHIVCKNMTSYANSGYINGDYTNDNCSRGSNSKGKNANSHHSDGSKGNGTNKNGVTSYYQGNYQTSSWKSNGEKSNGSNSRGMKSNGTKSNGTFTNSTYTKGTVQAGTTCGAQGPRYINLLCQKKSCSQACPFTCPNNTTTTIGLSRMYDETDVTQFLSDTAGYITYD